MSKKFQMKTYKDKPTHYAQVIILSKDDETEKGKYNSLL